MSIGFTIKFKNCHRNNTLQVIKSTFTQIVRIIPGFADLTFNFYPISGWLDLSSFSIANHFKIELEKE
jgi:hypothetical protein